ncbi:hypothetical protein EJ110_NYTH01424 [Nymphaea thermarum]|nr:hypothetical protein EJ110_NYTH01424 [Nymphaea thermarum]
MFLICSSPLKVNRRTLDLQRRFLQFSLRRILLLWASRI